MITIRITAMFAVVLLAGLVMPASAQNALPVSLSGNWTSPDNMYSQVFEIEDIGTSPTVTYWSNRSGCTMEKVPAIVQRWDGKDLHFVIKVEMPCFESFEAKLTKEGDVYKGKLYAPGLTYPELDLTLR
ncbi:MAG: hypothetical protein A2664_04920 [Candidatus Taylorbacteria bacterium RIFCSPHIGHO2_01_FULL_46_22b]|uniref:Uncharacterized protein n=1 Tax=Candidatus Taylorbacteria bacterium RIFCSPHIGHO2_01_FULL_46_22b TaxID=1802301 RepID=A0A1G2M3E8_9BACT|nr:MAG: hypothetical protein A2664_04920 [Candidatus Taylorbacteria bacterium RIFCSPHIGHO2_01_FULL_46_22b]